MKEKAAPGKNIASQVRTLAEPVAAELGLILWDVRFVKEGASWFLKVVIDKEGGVSIDDCEGISKRISKLLDDTDPIEQSYYLEVSSAGIERELFTDEHYGASLGKYVNVHLIRPIEGIRDYGGILKEKEKSTVTIILDNGEEFNFGLSDAASVKLRDETNGEIDDNE